MPVRVHGEFASINLFAREDTERIADHIMRQAVLAQERLVASRGGSVNQPWKALTETTREWKLRNSMSLDILEGRTGDLLKRVKTPQMVRFKTLPSGGFSFDIGIADDVPYAGYVQEGTNAVITTPAQRAWMRNNLAESYEQGTKMWNYGQEFPIPARTLIGFGDDDMARFVENAVDKIIVKEGFFSRVGRRILNVRAIKAITSFFGGGK